MVFRWISRRAVLANQNMLIACECEKLFGPDHESFGLYKWGRKAGQRMQVNVTPPTEYFLFRSVIDLHDQ